MNTSQIKRLEKLERRAHQTRQPLLSIQPGETHLHCLQRHGYQPTNYSPEFRTFTHDGQTYRATFVVSEFPEECTA